MDDLLKEIRMDIKEMLQRQARMEERMSNHGEEMHQFKEETREKIDEVEEDANRKWVAIKEKLDPIYKWHIGAKWGLAAIMTVGSIISVYMRLL